MLVYNHCRWLVTRIQVTQVSILLTCSIVADSVSKVLFGCIDHRLGSCQGILGTLFEGVEAGALDKIFEKLIEEAKDIEFLFFVVNLAG